MIPEKHVSSIPTGRLASLDGMRGVAALMVALYHWGLATQPIAQPGYLAVDFFFALSGYVLALIYSARLSGDSLDGSRFIKARFIRFYPIYFVGHCLGILRDVALRLGDGAGGRMGVDWILAVLFGFLMLPTPVTSGTLFPLNVPAWTLFLELAINIVFALGMFRWSTPVLAAIMAVSAAILLGFLGKPLFFDVGYSYETLFLGVARLGYSFPVGIILFRWMQGTTRKQSPLSFLPIIILALCLFFEMPESYRGAWESVCVFILFPLLLAAGIKFELPNWAARGFLFLGAVSFAVYAIHGPLILFVNKAVEILGLGRWAGIAVFISVLLVGGQLVNKLFDEPVRGAITRWRSARET